MTFVLASSHRWVLAVDVSNERTREAPIWRSVGPDAVDAINCVDGLIRRNGGAELCATAVAEPLPWRAATTSEPVLDREPSARRSCCLASIF